jgi:hypothetical protein
MWTVPRVLVWRTVSPAYADFGGLSSGAAPVIVSLDVVSFQPHSSVQTVAGFLFFVSTRTNKRHHHLDILLDVIGGVEITLREGCPRLTTGVSQHWFSGHFRQVFFSTNALPRINICVNVWGESSIMTGVYQCWCSSTLHIGWGLCDSVCQVLVCRGRYCLGGVWFFSSFWDRILEE